MGLDDFTWTVAPPPGRRRLARAVGWSLFWVAVLAAAIALGWGLAVTIASGRPVP